jgi:hypothetical protein
MRPHLPFAMVAVSLLLASCSMVSDLVDRITPRAAEPAPQPDPEPDHRQLIAARFRELFPESGTIRAVAISRGVRRHQLLEGLAWRACLKVEGRNLNGESIGVLTYVVAIRFNRIVDRRRATPVDFCETEQFDPFDA